MTVMNSITEAGEFVFSTAAVFVKGVGILALQATNVSTFQEYEKVSEHDFTLIQEQVYVFQQSENQAVSCVEELPRNINTETLTIKKGDTYKVTDINYIGQMDKDGSNNMAESVTIQIGELEENSITIRLDHNNYGLSVKDRIDLLELCR